MHIRTTKKTVADIPELAAQWHQDKNGDLTSKDVTPGSGKKVWWRCPVDPSHEWQSTILNRVNGNGCPACTGKMATPTTSLRALHPALAAEWHPSKNGGLTPDDVVPGSHKKAWWQCSVDPSHEWEATVVNRIKGRSCPVCAGKKVTHATSLRAQHPKLAAEWHPTKNEHLTPDDVRPGSNKKVWWQCSINPSHEWQASITNRVKGRGCNACLGRSATTTTSLRATHEELAAEWHPTKNRHYRF